MIKRFFLTLALAVGLLSPANSAGLYPLSRYQQFDSNGKLMVGAKLYLFNGGTTTPRIGYKDSSLTSPHTNPIVADASGRLPLIYLADGFYRQRLTTSTGVPVFDDDGLPVLSSTAGGSGTSVDPNSTYKTRDIKVRFDNQPLAGYVRLNGRTIGSAGSGASERANIDTQPLYEELWQFTNISIVGGKGASATADFVANKPLTLPNAAGRGIFGVDDMGAGPQGVLTAATIASPTVLGSSGGFETVTISQSMLPSYSLTGPAQTVAVTGSTSLENTNHTHSFNGTTGLESANHTHSGSGTTGGMNANNPHSHGVSGGTIGGTSSFPVGGPTDRTMVQNPAGIVINSTNIDHGHDYSFTTGTQSVNHTHAFSGTTNVNNVNHQHSLTGTGTTSSPIVSSGGGGVASPNMPPALLFTIYIRL